MANLNLGQRINLDEGNAKIINGDWIDDIRSICPELNIEFMSPNRLTFTDTADTYITFKTIDWVPVSFSQIKSSEDSWTYNMKCHPKQVHNPIYTPCIDTFSLASAMGLTISPDSENLKIPCPIRNLYSGFMIQEIRKQSMNIAASNGNIGDAYMIYFDGKQFYSCTWDTLLKNYARSLDQVIPELNGTNIVKYVQDEIATDLCAVQHPKVFGYNAYLYRMMKEKIDFVSTQPLGFTNMYTVRFADTSDLDQPTKMMCIRSKFNFTQANGFNSTLCRITTEI